MNGSHDLGTLWQQLEAHPETARRNRALGCLRLSQNAHALTPDPAAAERLRITYLALARAKLEAGLDDHLSSTPVQIAAIPAKPLARFFPDEKRPKPDPCNSAKGIWGRAAKGVI